MSTRANNNVDQNQKQLYCLSFCKCAFVELVQNIEHRVEILKHSKNSKDIYKKYIKNKQEFKKRCVLK